MAEVLDVAGALRSASAVSSLDSAALQFDPLNLTVSYGVPIGAGVTDGGAEKIKERATLLSQALFNQLFSLPVEKSDVGPLAVISGSGVSGASGAVYKAISIPREKPVPRPKPETRWQKFARENNIQKTKRSRNVFDEATGEYLPRWGRGSVKKVAEDSQWVIEEKQRPDGYIPAADEEAYEDPFQKSRVEKKKSMEDQRRRERRNLAARAKEDAKSAFAATSLSAATSSIRSPASISQARLMKAVKLAQKSTRSMGDFDEHRPDEPALRKKRSHAKISGDEKSTTMKVLNKVMNSTSESTSSVTGAVNKLLDEQRKSSKRRKTTESN
eukprot:TRINITY_DN9944_c0_g1_i1.p1 TRINITY_DN9944_c0_g1~~TRINITY_DN9944_c0_g1_i1.p1  ORF type:complete len:328 (-),score=79.69 TRINITY_DN9944_c0_g1_i1:45-1028(-)